MFNMVGINRCDAEWTCSFLHLIKSIEQGKQLTLLDPLATQFTSHTVDTIKLFHQPIRYFLLTCRPGSEWDNHWQESSLVDIGSCNKIAGKLEQQYRFSGTWGTQDEKFFFSLIIDREN